MEKKLIEQVFEQQVKNSENAFKKWSGKNHREAKINGFEISFNKDEGGNYEFFQKNEFGKNVSLELNEEQKTEILNYIIEKSSLDRLQNHKSGLAEGGKADFEQIKKTNSKIPENVDDYKTALEDDFLKNKTTELSAKKSSVSAILESVGAIKSVKKARVAAESSPDTDGELAPTDENSPIPSAAATTELKEKDYAEKFAEITEKLRQQISNDRATYGIAFNEDGSGDLRDEPSDYYLKAEKDKAGNLTLKYGYIDNKGSVIKDAVVPLDAGQQAEAKSHLKTIRTHSALKGLKGAFEQEELGAIKPKDYAELKKQNPSLPENMEDAKKLLNSEHFDKLEAQAIESRKALHDLARDNLKLERLESRKPQVKEAREAWDKLTDAYAKKHNVIEITFPNDSNAIQQFFGKQKIESLKGYRDDSGQISFTYVKSDGQEASLKLTPRESQDLFRMMAKEKAYTDLGRFANGNGDTYAEMKQALPELAGTETLRNTLKNSGNFKTGSDALRPGPLDVEAQQNLKNIASQTRDGVYTGVSTKNKLLIGAGVLGGLGLIGADAAISVFLCGHPPQIMGALGNLAGMALNYWRDMKQDGRINRTDERALEMQQKMQEQLAQFKDTHKTELAAKDGELAKLTAMVEKMMVNATKEEKGRPKDEVKPGAELTRDEGVEVGATRAASAGK